MSFIGRWLSIGTGRGQRVVIHDSEGGMGWDVKTPVAQAKANTKTLLINAFLWLFFLWTWPASVWQYTLMLVFPVLFVLLLFLISLKGKEKEKEVAGWFWPAIAHRIQQNIWRDELDEAEVKKAWRWRLWKMRLLYGGILFCALFLSGFWAWPHFSAFADGFFIFKIPAVWWPPAGTLLSLCVIIFVLSMVKDIDALGKASGYIIVFSIPLVIFLHLTIIGEWIIPRLLFYIVFFTFCLCVTAGSIWLFPRFRHEMMDLYEPPMAGGLPSATPDSGRWPNIGRGVEEMPSVPQQQDISALS